MRSVLSLINGLLLCISAFSAETRHIHLLKILDSENPDPIIREACQNISADLDKETRLLQQYLDIYTVHEHEVTGSHFNREDLIRKVDYEMSYLEGDIVILVYVGHGYRSSEMKGAAPMLYLNNYEESVNFQDIQQFILEKRPSVLMSIVLACNKTQTDFNQPPDIIAYNEPLWNVSLKAPGPIGRKIEKYQALFSEIPTQTRCIDLFGADKEYLTFISQSGGVFYNEIFNTLHRAFSNDHYITWENICKDIEASTIERLQYRGIESQKPLCQYYLSIHPVEIGDGRAVRVDQDYFKQYKRELKKRQKSQLRALRRDHRQQIRAARKLGKSRHERKVMSLQHKADLNQLKVKHKVNQIRLEKRYGDLSGSQ